MKLKNILIIPLLVVIVPVLIILLPILIPSFLLGTWMRGLYLRNQFALNFGNFGKRFVLVYSESPNWQGYIEENWLPKLHNHAVVLNWSKRNVWQKAKPLEAKILRHWGGDREFNPMVVYFPKVGRVKTIRFFQAFKDFKHGKEHSLRKAERELFALVDQV
jgi:hypothetical protein